MQSIKDPWFVLERSEALASWLLTSRKDVRVRRENMRDDGVDLLVEIDLGDRSFPNLFVVLVKGASTPDPSQWKESLNQQFTYGSKSFSVPACLFVINVRTNEAQFSWIAEPVVGEDSAELLFDTEGNFHPLNIEAVNEIVDRVRIWYEHLPQHFKHKAN
jgi:hypothetical protein